MARMHVISVITMITTPMPIGTLMILSFTERAFTLATIGGVLRITATLTTLRTTTAGMIPGIHRGHGAIPTTVGVVVTAGAGVAAMAGDIPTDTITATGPVTGTGTITGIMTTIITTVMITGISTTAITALPRHPTAHTTTLPGGIVTKRLLLQQEMCRTRI